MTIPPSTNEVNKKVNNEQPQRVNPHPKVLSWKKGENLPMNHGYRLRSRNTILENYKSSAAKKLLAQHIFSHKAHQIYNKQGKDC